MPPFGGIYTIMRYILASASPRRRELLAQILPRFEVISAEGEEKVNLSLFPENVALGLAEHKCDEVFAANADALVIGCDTIVVCEGEILGKPKDAADAERTLARLSGKTHYVITGVCVRYGDRKLTRYEKTEVRFNVLSPEFIAAYVGGGSPMDKAGSYGIQDEGLVKSYYGSYTNVVGLPVNLTKNMLEEILR